MVLTRQIFLEEWFGIQKSLYEEGMKAYNNKKKNMNIYNYYLALFIAFFDYCNDEGGQLLLQQPQSLHTICFGVW